MITGCTFGSGTGQPSPAPGRVPSSRPDRQRASERRIACVLNLGAHAWWLAPAVAALAHSPWWALALVILCMAAERARRSYVTRRQARRAAFYGGEDARRLADRIRVEWSTASEWAGITHMGWRPVYDAFQAVDSLAAKVDRFHHMWRRPGQRPWPPQLLAIDPHPLGLALTLACGPGQTADSYRQAASRLASALAVERIDVHRGPADLVQLVIVTRSLLAEPISLPPPGPAPRQWAAELGVRDDGRPCAVRLDVGMLIGGMPGAGKSGWLGALLAATINRSDVKIAGIDLKDGLELGPWRPGLLRVATTLEDAVAVLEDGVEHLRQRNFLMRMSAVRHITDLADPDAHPLRIIVIDEAADLFVSPPGDKAAREHTERALAAALAIARKGRAGGVVLVVCTQKPDSIAVPTVLRDQLGIRVACRTSTRQHAETILGGLVDLAEVPWQIPADAPGTALVAGSGPDPFVARAFHVTAEDVRRIVKPPGGDAEPA